MKGRSSILPKLFVIVLIEGVQNFVRTAPQNERKDLSR